MKQRPIRHRLAAAVFAVSAAVVNTAFAQDDPLVNRLLASQCSQCHGYNGNALGDIDSLAGESRNEITEEMLEARWERASGIMDHQALGYTEDQIRRLGAYFASADRFRDPDLRAPLTPPGASGGGSGDDEADEEDRGDKARDKDREDEGRDRDREDRDEADRDRDERHDADREHRDDTDADEHEHDRQWSDSRDREDEARSRHKDEDEDEDKDKDRERRGRRRSE